MGVNAAQHFMNQAPFHSTFPILVIIKSLGILKKFDFIIKFFIVNSSENSICSENCALPEIKFVCLLIMVLKGFTD